MVRSRTGPMALLCCALLACGLAAGCRQPSVPSDPSGPPVPPGSDPLAGLPETGARFTVFPVDTAELMNITPLGWLSPPGHTFPSDHMYLNFKDQHLRHKVVMPGEGILTWILHADTVGDGADYKLQGQLTRHFWFYLDHLSELDSSLLARIPPIHLGGNNFRLKLHPGEVLGWSGSPAAPKISMDFGCFCDTVNVPFVVPAHYNWSTLRADSPLHYYAPGFRDALVAMVNREGPDREGGICYDVDGTLAGNWFSQGTTDQDWTRLLALVPDPLHPQYPRVAMGGELGQIGIFALRFSAPPFTAITPASGFTRQALLGWDPNLAGRSYDYPVRGWLLTQLLDARTLKVEVRWAESDSTTGFTGAARSYTR